MALIQGIGSMIPECLKVLLFLCSFSAMSAFSRGVAMKILTAVAFDGAHLALPAGNPTYPNVSLQHHALFSPAEEHPCHTGSEQGGPCMATEIILAGILVVSPCSEQFSQPIGGALLTLCLFLV